MSASIFDNKLVMPDDKMMEAELGNSYKLFTSICDFIKSEFGDLAPEWKFYNQKSGWTLKLFHKKRNLIFIVPHRDFFYAAMVFGDKAVDKILAAEFPEDVKRELVTTKKYVEGRALRKDVRTNEDAALMKELIRIKMAK